MHPRTRQPLTDLEISYELEHARERAMKTLDNIVQHHGPDSEYADLARAHCDRIETAYNEMLAAVSPLGGAA